MKELKISITHIKILATIDNLNKKNLYPLSDGIYKIIAGVVDEETTSYMDEPTFGTLISFNSKKTCRYLLALQRHKYIKKVYSKLHDVLVYTLTELGRDELAKFYKRHKAPFIKKSRAFKETIIKL